MSDAGIGHGLVLVHGSAASSTRWLRRGLVAVRVAPLGAWTGIVLADDRSRAAAPYDVGLEVLAARPLPFLRRPGLGFFVVQNSAVLTVQARSWRSPQRWAIWQPGTGLRPTPNLAPLPPALLVRAAGAARRTSIATIESVLAAADGTPLAKLVEILDTLGLPGAGLLATGGDADLVAVEPSAKAVRTFDALVAEESAHHTSLQPERR